MPEPPLRNRLVAAREALTEQITQLDQQLQQLAGATPEERHAFIRRMTRRITLPGAWLLVGVAVAYTFLRKHSSVVVFAAGMTAGATVVVLSLPTPDGDRDYVEPPPRPTFSVPAPTPSPTPTPPIPPLLNGTPPPAIMPPGPDATVTPEPSGPGPTGRPPRRPPRRQQPPEAGTPCLRVLPLPPSVDLPECVDLLGLRPDLAPGAVIAVPP